MKKTNKIIFVIAVLIICGIGVMGNGNGHKSGK